MASVVLTGDTSGSGTITVPAVAGSFTATIGSATGTHYPFTAGTAVASTSGTSIDFTSIPSWVKRITVMLVGVSTSGTSIPLIRLGTSGGIQTTSYLSGTFGANSSTLLGWGSSTVGFNMQNATSAADILHGNAVFTLQDASTNKWTGTWGLNNSGGSGFNGAGSVTLSGTLTQIRYTTTNGTDTFDAGSINILYE